MNKYVSARFSESGYDRKSVSLQIAEWLNKKEPISYTVVRTSGNEVEIVALISFAELEGNKTQ